MKIKFKRQKPRKIFFSVLYRLSKLPWASKKKKMKIYLDLEWMFNRLALEQPYKIYEPENHPNKIYSLNFLMNNIKESYVVLDLGCKYGEISYKIANKARKVIGIDHDKTAVEIAKSRYNKDNLTFIHSEAIDYLSKSKEKFNVLILSHTLEHLDEPEKFIINYKRYFDYIFIELPDFDLSYLNHYRYSLKLPLIYTDDDHIWEFDRDEIKKLCEKCGLKILNSECRFGVQKYWCQT